MLPGRPCGRAASRTWSRRRARSLGLRPIRDGCRIVNDGSLVKTARWPAAPLLKFSLRPDLSHRHPRPAAADIGGYQLGVSLNDKLRGGPSSGDRCDSGSVIRKDSLPPGLPPSVSRKGVRACCFIQARLDREGWTKCGTWNRPGIRCIKRVCSRVRVGKAPNVADSSESRRSGLCLFVCCCITKAPCHGTLAAPWAPPKSFQAAPSSSPASWTTRPPLQPKRRPSGWSRGSASLHSDFPPPGRRDRHQLLHHQTHPLRPPPIPRPARPPASAHPRHLCPVPASPPG